MNTHDKIELPPLPEPHTIERVWEDPYCSILKDTKFYAEHQVREAQQAAIEAALQSPEIQALRKDAERINWIESQYGADIVCLDTEQWEVSSTDAFGEGLILRDAIDAAMEKQK